MTHTYFFQFFRSSRYEDICILQNAAFFCTMPRGLGLRQKGVLRDSFVALGSVFQCCVTGGLQNRIFKNFPRVKFQCCVTGAASLEFP